MKYFIFLTYILIFTFLQAQGTDTLTVKQNEFVKVDSVKITGNDVTKEFVILRELTFSEGDSVDAKIIEYNRERVFSLGLFNRVEIILTKTNEFVTANIDLKETWYIFPLPYFENKGADFKRMRIGLYLLYKNFRGRNETISSKVGFGYDPFYSVTFESPLLLEGTDIQFAAGFVNMKISNKSDILKAKLASEGKGNFDYRAITGFTNFGRRLNKFNRVYLSLQYSYYEMPFHLDQATSSDGRIDRVFSSGLTYVFDTRDLVQNPSNGIYFTTSFTHSGFGVDDRKINKLSLDFRQYYKLADNIFTKYRIYSRNIYGDNIPRYNYSYLGVHEFVRGHKNDQREAKNLLFGSVELNYSILKEWNFSFKLPLLPEKLTTYRIGIMAKLFADFGTVFDHHSEIHFNGFDSGYGGGLLLLVLPHKAFRFEYAVNKYGKGEFILGAGFSF